MKRILITGTQSYIGMSVEDWLKREPHKYKIETIDMKTNDWKNHDFSNYDTVFHVAGIAHVDVGGITEEIKQLYYKVNTQLAIDTAKKAKQEGVAQFIFMSSMIIYGESAPIGKKKVITRATKPSPANFYGDSKLQGDLGIQKLDSEKFKVVILRPPMIYGRGSKGNYPLLSKLARKTFLFPNINNERSMLYIRNLCEFIKLMIDHGERGVFFPQNEEYTQTSNMVEMISKTWNRKIYLTKMFNWCVYLIACIPGKMGGLVNKAFGNMTYDLKISEYSKSDYRIYTLQKSIEITEGNAE